QVTQTGAGGVGDRQVRLEVEAADLVGVVLLTELLEQGMGQQRRGHALGLGQAHLQLHADSALVDEFGRVQAGLERIWVAAQLSAVMGALAARELRLGALASDGDLPGCLGSGLIQARDRDRTGPGETDPSVRAGFFPPTALKSRLR